MANAADYFFKTSCFPSLCSDLKVRFSKLQLVLSINFVYNRFNFVDCCVDSVEEKEEISVDSRHRPLLRPVERELVTNFPCLISRRD